MSESRWLMSRKQKYRKQFSKKASEAVLEEILKMEVPAQPRNPMIRSGRYISQQLVNKPYQNKDIEILFDVTMDTLWVYDHVHQICHSFSRDISHFQDQDGSVLPVYKDLKETLKAHLKDIKGKAEFDNPVPDLNLKDGDISFNCTHGAFFDSTNTLLEDFIPCLLTPNEVVISAKAVEQIGNGNMRNGGHALMMLNTIARAVND